MVNPFADVKWNPDTGERRKFAKSLVIGFPILAALSLVAGWLGKGSWHANLKFSLWLAAAGAGAGILFWLIPQIARPFYVTWYFLGCCIGIVVGNLLLAGFYYFILTPIGVVKRAAGRPGVSKGFDRSAASYWEDVPAANDPRRYYRQF